MKLIHEKVQSSFCYKCNRMEEFLYATYVTDENRIKDTKHCINCGHSTQREEAR